MLSRIRREYRKGKVILKAVSRMRISTKITVLYAAVLMVISEKMQHRVNCEECNLSLEGMIVFIRLLNRLLYRDNYISDGNRS